MTEQGHNSDDNQHLMNNDNQVMKMCRWNNRDKEGDSAVNEGDDADGQERNGTDRESWGNSPFLL